MVVGISGHRFGDWRATSEGIAPEVVAHRTKKASTVSLSHIGVLAPGRLNQRGTDSGIRTIVEERLASVSPSIFATSFLFKICTIYSLLKCKEFRGFT